MLVRKGVMQRRHCHADTAFGFETDAAAPSAELFNSSRVRFRRAIFCFRSRWNLALSPLIPDM
jgi:hypothetical protein